MFLFPGVWRTATKASKQFRLKWRKGTCFVEHTMCLSYKIPKIQTAVQHTTANRWQRWDRRIVEWGWLTLVPADVKRSLKVILVQSEVFLSTKNVASFWVAATIHRLGTACRNLSLASVVNQNLQTGFLSQSCQNVFARQTYVIIITITWSSSRYHHVIIIIITWSSSSSSRDHHHHVVIITITWSSSPSRDHHHHHVIIFITLSSSSHDHRHHHVIIITTRAQ